jgi:hypothetical protein
MNKRVARWTLIPIGIGFLAIALFLPIETIVSPAWEIKVLASDGSPLGGCVVEQRWSHYQLDPTYHFVQPHTGADGIVRLDKRTVSGSLAVRGYRYLRDFLPSLGVHTGLGPSSMITVSPRYREVIWVTETEPTVTISKDPNKKDAMLAVVRINEKPTTNDGK